METPLAKALVERNMTASQLAEKCGCDKSHISNILNAKIILREFESAPAKKVIVRAGAVLAREIVKHLGGVITVHQILFPEDYDPELAAAVLEAEAWTKAQADAFEQKAA